MMNINDLTIGQARELANLFGSNAQVSTQDTLNDFVDEKVIIRTYSAGVWFGTLSQKAGEEVILTNARRLYYWQVANNKDSERGISLSEVSLHGLTDNSKVCEELPKQWLKAIEIIPCSEKAIKSIESKANYVA